MSKYGKNMTELIKRFIVIEAVPSGGGVESAIEFFTDASKRKQVLENAETKALQAIALVRSAPDNPYGNDEEVIAGEILKQLSERENKNAS